MRRTTMIAVTVAVLTVQVAPAQVRNFPYDARVVVDEVYVRSGSGTNSQYYPTQKLLRDALVTVRRHEPGGWLMIDPPDGSFSWVPQKYVDRTGETGTITEDNVVVFVGSDFGDESGVWQRSLRAGERVTILGERSIDTTRGLQTMYQIAPPAREYRWIPGSAVVPVNDAVRQQLDSDPYAMPSQARRPARPESPAGTAVAGAVDTPEIAPSTQLSRLQRIRTEQQQLAEIDQRFRNMVLQQPSQWDLQTIENDYRDLQQRATWKPVAGQIDLRYPALDRCRQRKAEFEDFKRLTSATERRDAELIAAQRATSQSYAAIPPLDPNGIVAAAGPESTLPEGFPPNLAQLFSGADPTTSTATDFGTSAPVNMNLTETAALSGDPTFDVSPESARSRYVGAGIISRPAGRSDDADGYLLTSPAGQILAHLKPEDGVDLEHFVGKEVGLHGSRWYKDDLKSDYIEVSGLEAVRIRR